MMLLPVDCNQAHMRLIASRACLMKQPRACVMRFTVAPLPTMDN